jgi:YEATS domain-containing protein 4
MENRFYRSIIYGSCAVQLNKILEDGTSHKWYIYVRPFKQDEDFSYIKKVTFSLHETFDKPKRTIYKQPFEVLEKGLFIS